MNILWFTLIVPIICTTADEMYIGTNDVNTTQPEIRICTSMKIDDNYTYHLTEFLPVAGENVHHITLNVCTEPSSDQRYWDCGPSSNRDPAFTSSGHCKNMKNHKWLYGWAYRASKVGLSIPDGFAFQVGKDTKHKYFIFETHYSKPTLSKSAEDSKAGVIIKYEKKPITDTEIAMVDITTKQAHLPILAKKVTTLDTLNEVSTRMDPLIFHIHIHGLGTKVSGYVIKRNEQNPDNPIWIQLGLQSPTIPQDYYPVSNRVTVEPGDLVAMRCTYYNYKEHDVKIGPTDSDEMCEIGIIYAIKRGSELQPAMASKPGDWNRMGLKNIPADA